MQANGPRPPFALAVAISAAFVWRRVAAPAPRRPYRRRGGHAGVEAAIPPPGRVLPAPKTRGDIGREREGGIARPMQHVSLPQRSLRMEEHKANGLRVRIIPACVLSRHRYCEGCGIKPATSPGQSAAWNTFYCRGLRPCQADRVTTELAQRPCSCECARGGTAAREFFPRRSRYTRRKTDSPGEACRAIGQFPRAGQAHTAALSRPTVTQPA